MVSGGEGWPAFGRVFQEPCHELCRFNAAAARPETRIPGVVGSQGERPMNLSPWPPGTIVLRLGSTLKRILIGAMTMPAKSKAQQKAAGAALAAKRGEIPKSKLQGASKSMVESMTEKELDELASTKRKGKPEHVSKH